MATATFQIRPAARTSANPLIGLYGLSGTGKTFSALLLARGLVGPEGKIVMIDTESGRGELYADVIAGGYDVIELGEPFSPERYVEAIAIAEKAGAGVLIIDSASHSWEGMGGVVDQAGEIEKRTGKPGLHCWRDPKISHQRMVLALLRTKMPVLVCLRAKHKSRQVPDPKRTGKMTIVRDDHTTPIQAEDFIYELTVHAEIEQDHKLRVTKISHPALGEIFRDGELVSIATGEALARWASGGGERKRADPFEEAADAASEGREAFMAWWRAQPAATRVALKPRMDELQRITEAADNGASADDPFDERASEPATPGAEAAPELAEPERDDLGLLPLANEPPAEPPTITPPRNPTGEEWNDWCMRVTDAIGAAPTLAWLEAFLERNRAAIAQHGNERMRVRQANALMEFLAQRRAELGGTA